MGESPGMQRARQEPGAHLRAKPRTGITAPCTQNALLVILRALPDTVPRYTMENSNAPLLRV